GRPGGRPGPGTRLTRLTARAEVLVEVSGRLAARFPTQNGSGGSHLAEADTPDGVVGALLEDELGSLACGLDVLPQVEAVDVQPDGAGDVDRLPFGEGGEVTEERRLVAEGRLPQGEEAVNVHMLNDRFYGDHVASGNSI